MRLRALGTHYICLIMMLIAGIERCTGVCDSEGLKHSSWLLGSGWIAKSDTNGLLYFEANHQNESYSWLTNRVLDGTWAVGVDFNIDSIFVSGGVRGSASLAFAIDHSEPQPRLLVEVNRHQGNFLLVEAFYYDSNQVWQTILSSGWRPATNRVFHLAVERTSGPSLKVSLMATGGDVLFEDLTIAVPTEALARIAGTGLRVVGSRTLFTKFSFRSPLTTDDASTYFRKTATCALADLMGLFWTGDHLTGRIRNTWNGYTGNLPDSRGVLWERGTLIFALDALSRATGDQRIRERISADWRRTKAAFSTEELQACGSQTVNPASDDAGWSALMYLAAYRATSDPQALARCHGIVSNAFTRWADDQLGGGMWYSDTRDIKSLYQTALILGALRIYEAQGNTSLRDNALACADWIETHLLRTDGLYWCDFNSAGPVGADRPYDIQEAGSVTFLGGNMAMGVIHAWRYRRTGEQVYLARARRTASAIYDHLRQGHILINDRDAWTNGSFTADWAEQVLTLPGVPVKHWQLIRSTAESIAVNARTYLGYYGGSWGGPAEGDGSRWWLALSRPQQIMTSASSVSMIAAAALLEAQDLTRFRPILTMLRPDSGSPRQLQIAGETGWEYVVEESDDLTHWNIATNLTLPSSRVNVTLPQTSDATARFYRGRIYFNP